MIELYDDVATYKLCFNIFLQLWNHAYDTL